MNKTKRDPTKEYPDPTPVEIPMDMKRPETMDQKIKRIIETQISEKAAMLGEETFEEANDFDIKDDFEVEEPVSVYEVHEMEDEYPQDLPLTPEEPQQEGETAPPQTEDNKSSLENSESDGVASSAMPSESQPESEKAL